MPDATNSKNRIAIAGDGPVALTAALALTRTHAVTVLRQPVGAIPPTVRPPRRDGRTAALFPASVRLLQRLAVWQHCETAAAPMTAIQIIDDRAALLRAPDVMFRARDIGLDALGYNIANAELVAALQRAVTELAIVSATMAGPKPYTIAADGIAVATAAGIDCFALLVAADGRKSAAREAAGLPVETWTYPQVAITSVFDHARDHAGVSTELHRAAGPCTTVPLPGRRSSLVWVESPAVADMLLALDDDGFRRKLEERLAGLLGSIGAVSARSSLPLTGLKAARLAGNRTILAGEAAHVFPPIGAQGLNLGLRDVAALAECVAAAGSDDAGDAAVLSAYRTAREFDVQARTLAVDALDRSLLTAFVPAHLLRGLGLSLLHLAPALRRQLMRQGLSDARSEPALMRP